MEHFLSRYICSPIFECNSISSTYLFESLLRWTVIVCLGAHFNHLPISWTSWICKSWEVRCLYNMGGKLTMHWCDTKSLFMELHRLYYVHNLIPRKTNNDTPLVINMAQQCEKNGSKWWTAFKSGTCKKEHPLMSKSKKLPTSTISLKTMFCVFFCRKAQI